MDQKQVRSEYSSYYNHTYVYVIILSERIVDSNFYQIDIVQSINKNDNLRTVKSMIF